MVSGWKTEFLQNAQVKISSAYLGAAWHNSHAEKHICVTKEDIDLTEHQDYWDAFQ